MHLRMRSVAKLGGARNAGSPKDIRVVRSGAGLLPHLERLDDVADLDVVVVAQGQTALETLADLGGVVLEPLERGDGEILRHHRTVAQEPGLGVAADDARPHDATRDAAEPGRAADLADLRRT